MKMEGKEMYDLNQLIMMGREENASDLHISAGMPLMMRVHGKLEHAGTAG